VIDGDEEPLSPRCLADIGDQVGMAFEPVAIGAIMRKIALEQDDAGGLEVAQQRAI